MVKYYILLIGLVAVCISMNAMKYPYEPSFDYDPLFGYGYYYGPVYTTPSKKTFKSPYISQRLRYHYQPTKLDRLKAFWQASTYEQQFHPEEKRLHEKYKKIKDEFENERKRYRFLYDRTNITDPYSYSHTKERLHLGLSTADYPKFYDELQQSTIKFRKLMEQEHKARKEYEKFLKRKNELLKVPLYD